MSYGEHNRDEDRRRDYSASREGQEPLDPHASLSFPQRVPPGVAQAPSRNARELHRLTNQERRLINHAAGRSEPDQSTRLATQDKIWYTGRFCDQLRLSAQQKEEAKGLMADLNLDKFGNQKRIEKIALVVIRHIVERDKNRGAAEYCYRMTSNERFLELMESNDMDRGDLMRLSPKVTDEIRKIRSGES